jgi:hypothetical protein
MLRAKNVKDTCSSKKKLLCLFLPSFLVDKMGLGDLPLEQITKRSYSFGKWVFQPRFSRYNCLEPRAKEFQRHLFQQKKLLCLFLASFLVDKMSP